MIDPSHRTETLAALPSLVELEIAQYDNVLHINSWRNHYSRKKKKKKEIKGCAIRAL